MTVFFACRHSSIPRTTQHSLTCSRRFVNHTISPHALRHHLFTTRSCVSVSLQQWLVSRRGFSDNAPPEQDQQKQQQIKGGFQFRTKFDEATLRTINWFPGHMAKARRQIEEQLKQVDLVVEVRDARIPFSSANPLFEDLISRKKRVVIMNKADLANSNMQQRISSHFQSLRVQCFFTTASKVRGTAKIIPSAIKELQRSQKNENALLRLMIVGVPNVGKSTIINSIHSQCRGQSNSRDIAKTGKRPGLTRQLGGFLVSEKPRAILVDTPGVMLPGGMMDDEEQALKLALVGCIKDTVVGEEYICEYLLYVLNNSKAGQNMYTKAFRMSGPTDDVTVFLHAFAKRYGISKRAGGGATSAAVSTHDDHDLGEEEEFDHLIAARQLLQQYRLGQLGRYTLDSIPDADTPTNTETTTTAKEEQAEEVSGERAMVNEN
eukprot:TRINITY_DN4861_c0_g1_i1.p1 TRINITY_DN4861_c0_g1~~TRINITY_DN4861_c0_g1_i1.p1  ORF type:complete len:434 (-),score=87.59 TRINITY_DN4861_c0_g1_i1:52-1353(-)